MKNLCVIAVFFVLAMYSIPQAEAQLSTCWDTWSRCSRWSSAGTGRLWLSCNDKCIQDFGKRGGRCVKVPSKCPLSDKAWQCQCYN